jgi:hypothetical protein
LNVIELQLSDWNDNLSPKGTDTEHNALLESCHEVLSDLYQ